MRNYSNPGLEGFLSTLGVILFCSQGLAVLVHALFLMPSSGVSVFEYMEPFTLASYIAVPLIVLLPVEFIFGSSFSLAPPLSRYLLYKTTREGFDRWSRDYYAGKTHELLTPYLERQRRERREALVLKIQTRQIFWKEMASLIAKVYTRCLRDSLFLLGSAYFGFFVYALSRDSLSLGLSATQTRSLVLCAWSAAIMASSLVVMEVHRLPALLWRWATNKRKEKKYGTHS